MEEKEKAIQSGLAIDIYIDQALRVLEKLNPVNTLVPLMVPSAKGEAPIISAQDPRIKGIVDTWLTTYDEVLKASKNLPVDLIGRAATIARATRQGEVPVREVGTE